MPPRQGNAFIGFRAAPAYHERVELAAARMEVEKATWLRMIVDAALEFDEQVMSPTSIADVPITVAQVAAPMTIGAPGTDLVPPPEIVNTSLNPSKPNPRDCPHPPQYRMGSRCARCGSIVGKGAPRR